LEHGKRCPHTGKTKQRGERYGDSNAGTNVRREFSGADS